MDKLFTSNLEDKEVFAKPFAPMEEKAKVQIASDKDSKGENNA